MVAIEVKVETVNGIMALFDNKAIPKKDALSYLKKFSVEELATYIVSETTEEDDGDKDGFY